MWVVLDLVPKVLDLVDTVFLVGKQREMVDVVMLKPRYIRRATVAPAV